MQSDRLGIIQSTANSLAGQHRARPSRSGGRNVPNATGFAVRDRTHAGNGAAAAAALHPVWRRRSGVFAADVRVPAKQLATDRAQPAPPACCGYSSHHWRLLLPPIKQRLRRQDAALAHQQAAGTEYDCCSVLLPSLAVLRQAHTQVHTA